ncbi:MAG: ATP-binding protein, partial [Proteobacteria bacterium]|nr:ATP-binding protein [Pseudomonadota bacterium]
KGVVFYGPPGTGKTLFARALATALKASIRVVNGPELKSAWQGETERMIREIFEQARRYSPAVIVFDEFDSLAGDRRSASGGERSIVNQILTEMDGLSENNLVFTVATTNHPDILDEAMKRPGRFEFQIEIPYPHEVERRAIFDIYNKKYRLNLAESVLKYLVFRTEMVVDIASRRRFSGDHIEAICRAIMREKYRHQDLKITTAFLDKTVRGRTNQPESISSEEKKI